MWAIARWLDGPPFTPTNRGSAVSPLARLTPVCRGHCARSVFFSPFGNAADVATLAKKVCSAWLFFLRRTLSCVFPFPKRSARSPLTGAKLQIVGAFLSTKLLGR